MRMKMIFYTKCWRHAPAGGTTPLSPFLKYLRGILSICNDKCSLLLTDRQRFSLPVTVLMKIVAAAVSGLVLPLQEPLWTSVRVPSKCSKQSRSRHVPTLHAANTSSLQPGISQCWAWCDCLSVTVTQNRMCSQYPDKQLGLLLEILARLRAHS